MDAVIERVYSVGGYTIQCSVHTIEHGPKKTPLLILPAFFISEKERFFLFCGHLLMST